MIETKRLILRRWTIDDANSLYEYAKDPDIGPAAGWPLHQSVEESRSVIEHAFTGAQCYAICEKHQNIAIGAIELKLNGTTDKVKMDDECELGFWVGKPFWGKGYVPEAGQALIKYAFEQLGMKQIWCAYYDGNIKSKRVQEKLGFVFDHTAEVEVPLLNEHRISHVNILTQEKWKEAETNI